MVSVEYVYFVIDYWCVVVFVDVGIVINDFLDLLIIGYGIGVYWFMLIGFV